jgi:coproporphyrinogen III oxidase-like Fe-S oxidoreductase
LPISYDMPLYRPPSEGRNLIVQATLGCSFNRCTFCSMYKSKVYQARPLDMVCTEIDAAANRFPHTHRVFLADGDALALPTDHLVSLLDHLAARFCDLTRVTAYATPKNLLDKAPEDLALLRNKGLKLVYLGIESGSNLILKRIIKGASQKTHIKAIERSREAGIKVSATVILGLGGREDWQAHIEGTAELINIAPPTYLSTLQLMLDAASHNEFMERQPEGFTLQDDSGILAEQERLLSLLDPPRPIIFRSNHASNCLALAGNLPRDRKRLLGEIETVRSGVNTVRPEYLRGL